MLNLNKMEQTAYVDCSDKAGALHAGIFAARVPHLRIKVEEGHGLH